MSRKFLIPWAWIVCVALLAVSTACSEDEPPLPDNLVSFGTSAAGLTGEENAYDVQINLSRSESSPVALTVSYTADGVTYGDHFTTDPAASGTTLTVTIPANSTSASFKVKVNEGVFLEGDESITFAITAVNAQPAVLIGNEDEFKLSFSSIVSEGSQLTLQGLAGSEPGSGALNTVYVDFSSNQQKAVARDAWDLGFYAGDKFRVTLNNTRGSSAILIDKTNLNEVSAADVDADALAVGFGEGVLSLIDGVSGSLDETVIAEISATDADNKVYVINRSGGSGTVGAVENLVKVRILRNGNGYTLQHAKINETSFATAQISKDVASTFSYFHFENGTVDVEPPKGNWDIQWTWSIYFTGTLPYGFSDLVFLNHLNGVQAAEVLTSSVTYDAFGESNLAGVTLSGGRGTIGSNWRATTGTIGVRTDRFYVIQDEQGNVYKLKFISFHANDGGTRGKPVIEYALVKKAD